MSLPLNNSPLASVRDSSIQAVVFDMDGLMFNTEDLYAGVGDELLRRRGFSLTGELRDRMMGRPSRIAFQMMIDHHRLSDSVEALSAETEELFVPILQERLDTMPGLLELLQALEKANIPKGVATSSGQRFMQAVMGRFNLIPRFRFILTAEDVTHGKPHPEIYLKAALQHGVEPANILVLEDSHNGCLAAAEAGAFAVAVPTQHSREQCFQRADMVIESLADPRLYLKLGLG